MRWWWCLLLLAGGCGFQHGVAPGGDGGGDDGGVDASGDSVVQLIDGPPADAQQCWSVAGVNVSVCLTGPLSGTRDITSNTQIDTASTTDCATLQAGSTEVCVIAAATLRIQSGQTLSALGAKPLVLIANTVTVDGTIDVASHVRLRQGPASDLAGCNNGTNASGAGGGQGGSFANKGGDGGNQEGQTSSRGLAGAVLSNVTTLRGGCPGGHGGGTSFSLGHGGGAVMIVADTALTISSTGTINASGASAEHGIPTDQGGGGGGAGGMIVLSAPMITLDPSGQVFANGGHGGGGAGNSTSGGDGTDPTSPTSGGGGGAGGDAGGAGAPGYPSTTRSGKNGTSGGDGGGGGGGGAGIIHVYSTSSIAGANVSPPPS